MKKLNKLTATLLTVLILCSVIFIAPISANAYEALRPLPELTGDQRSDIVEIALSQVGYSEKNNDTYFGKWYGMPNQPWCAMFVSWCADTAGIPQNIIKHEAAVRYMQANFSSQGRFYTKDVYTPQRGDLVFFDSSESSGAYNHIGIVLSYDEKTRTLYTVEGNTGNPDNHEQEGVYRKTRDVDLSTFSVSGYANPKYAATTKVTFDNIKQGAEISGKNFEITGFVTNGGNGAELALYVESKLVQTVTPKDDGSFSFKLDTTKYKNGACSIKIVFSNSTGYEKTQYFTLKINNVAVEYTELEKILKARVDYVNSLLKEHEQHSKTPEYKELKRAADDALEILGTGATDDEILDMYDRINYCLDAFLGKLNISGSHGDVNGDGKINLEDVTALQRIIALLDSWDDYSDNPKRRADVDGDGTPTMQDVTMIQKYIAGLITEL